MGIKGLQMRIQHKGVLGILLQNLHILHVCSNQLVFQHLSYPPLQEQKTKNHFHCCILLSIFEFIFVAEWILQSSRQMLIKEDVRLLNNIFTASKYWILFNANWVYTRLNCRQKIWNYGLAFGLNYCSISPGFDRAKWDELHRSK